MATLPVALPFGPHQRVHASTRVHRVAYPDAAQAPRIDPLNGAFPAPPSPGSPVPSICLSARTSACIQTPACTGWHIQDAASAARIDQLNFAPSRVPQFRVPGPGFLP
ncbi:hypothetical protein XabCFBP2524_00355 [Xanthomonas axonopodis pv. begoniae]|nr:hypothetical protein XabCFBP2524_00355 [Xanthomonas axonopodis pv. begoniae]